ncbi:MAG: polynucleotide adenylyltransferase PcnB [Vicinamibacterales bacterium]
MVVPTIVPRAEHRISRRDIDPDALKVLYRLHQSGHAAYLVGGGVRDLLLGLHPKDFDIGTDAHPGQIKKQFRNCWIIGRRFRLAHVRFGPKTIEVATFRRQMPPEPQSPEAEAARHAVDNTWGTPEEDAFRRDFTVNALFYDIATFSVIDYVGGLHDLRARVIRSIGDPNVRFLEDPVRMLRAVVLAARLDFTIDPPILEAIARHREAIGLSAPARLMEEHFKILRSGASERVFRRLGDVGLLQHIAPPLMQAPEPFWSSLRRLDAYRRRFTSAPDTLTNAVLVGSVLPPIGALAPRPRRPDGEEDRPRGITLGLLPVPKRDVERLRHLMAIQRRLLDLDAPPRAQRGLFHRHILPEAVSWLEIHGGRPEVVDHWRALMHAPRAHHAADEGEHGQPQPPPQMTGDDQRPRRRRRRRRGGRRRRPRPVAE